MAQIPVLFTRLPSAGEKVLTTDDLVATIQTVEDGVVTADPLYGPKFKCSTRYLRWSNDLDIWAVSKEETQSE